MSLDTEKDKIEIQHMFKAIQQMDVEMKKANAETNKITKETVLYPFVVGAGVFGVAVVFVKLFLN